MSTMWVVKGAKHSLVPCLYQGEFLSKFCPDTHCRCARTSQWPHPYFVCMCWRACMNLLSVQWKEGSHNASVLKIEKIVLNAIQPLSKLSMHYSNANLTVVSVLFCPNNSVKHWCCSKLAKSDQRTQLSDEKDVNCCQIRRKKKDGITCASQFPWTAILISYNVLLNWGGCTWATQIAAVSVAGVNCFCDFYWYVFRKTRIYSGLLTL